MTKKDKQIRRKKLETKETKILQEIEDCKNALRNKKQELVEIETSNKPEESVERHAQILYEIEDIEQNLRDKVRNLDDVGCLIFNLECEIPENE